jgi:hypothetical protein
MTQVQDVENWTFTIWYIYFEGQLIKDEMVCLFQFLDVNCSPRRIGKERWPASPLINTEISNHVTILKLTCASKYLISHN